MPLRPRYSVHHPRREGRNRRTTVIAIAAAAKLSLLAIQHAPACPTAYESFDCSAFCMAGGDDCYLIHARGGCNDLGCAELVCSMKPTCCESAWDADCVYLANVLCGSDPSIPRQEYLNDLIDPEGGLATSPCGTPLSCVTDYFGEISTYVPTASTPVKTIAINFHFFQKSDGSGNLKNCPAHLADISTNVSWLNGLLKMYGVTPSDPCPGATYLTDTNVQVVLANVYFYQDDSLWATASPAILLQAAFAVHPEAREQFNILSSGGPGPAGASAFTVFPSFVDHQFDQYIVFPYATDVPCTSSALSWPITLIHELGHSLNLHHTYDGDTCSSTNCEYLPDVFCPPTNPCYMSAGWGCGVTDPTVFCSNNVMGGTKDSLHFTTLQIGKMHRALSITSAQKYVLPTPCLAPVSGIVLWLPLDEMSGTVAGNAPGGNNGTYVLNPGFLPNQHVLNSHSFNGVNQCVTVQSYPAIEIGTGDLSVEAWVRRAPGDNGNRTIVDKTKLFVPTRGYHLSLNNGVIEFELADGTAATFTSNTTVPQDGAWHHVAVTVDRDNSTGGVFYLDGSSVGSPFDPTIRPGSLSSTAALNVGTFNYFLNSFFYGAIDEVAVYSRALDASEIADIHAAGSDGRCRRYCHVPGDTAFILGDTKVTVSARICNAGTVPETFMYWFDERPSGGGCNIEGPTNFTPCSGKVAVPAGKCVTLPTQIDRPTGMNSLYDRACYRMTIQSLGSEYPFKSFCDGSVLDRSDIATNGGGNGSWTFAIGVSNDVTISLTNTGVASGSIPYMLAAHGPGMMSSASISLNDQEPGASVFGTANISLGEEGDVSVSVRFLEAVFGFSSLVLSTDTDGDGSYEALTTIDLDLVIPVTCPPDFNSDGLVNGDDLGTLLGQWGPCTRCAADFNGDGVVDGSDLAELLGAWGACV